MRLNQLGMSLIEIVVAIGLAGGVSLGVMKIIQNADRDLINFEKTNEVATTEGLIANFLLSKNGCQQMKGLNSGDEFTIRRPEQSYDKATNTTSVTFDKVIFQKDQEIGKIKINYIRVGTIQTLDATDNLAIAPVELEFMSRDNKFQFAVGTSRTYRRTLNIPVTIDSTGAVDSCNLEKYGIYNIVIKRICEDAFGLGLDDIDCVQAILEVEHRIKTSICDDITGETGKYSRSSGYCDIIRAHVGEACVGATEAAGGFSNGGSIVCRSF